MIAETMAGRWAVDRGALLSCVTSLTGSSAVRNWRRPRMAYRKAELSEILDTRIRSRFPARFAALRRPSVVVVAMLRKRRNAARQRPAISCKIHQGPWPPAERPGRAVVGSFQAQTGLGRCARRAEGDAKRARKIFGLLEIGRFFARQTLEQRLIWPGFANG